MLERNLGRKYWPCKIELKAEYQQYLQKPPNAYDQKLINIIF